MPCARCICYQYEISLFGTANVSPFCSQKLFLLVLSNLQFGRLICMPHIYNIIALWCVDSFGDVLVHSASPVLKAHTRTIVVGGQRQLQQRSIRLMYNTFLCLRRFKPRVVWCSGMDSPKPKRAPSPARQRTARTTPSPDLPLIRGTNAVAACAPRPLPPSLGAGPPAERQTSFFLLPHSLLDPHAISSSSFALPACAASEWPYASACVWRIDPAVAAPAPAAAVVGCSGCYA